MQPWLLSSLIFLVCAHTSLTAVFGKEEYEEHNKLWMRKSVIVGANIDENDEHPFGSERRLLRSTRRRTIGSTAPICTFNECRRCKSLQRCKANLVPVDPSDPMNSAYHYRCVCLQS